MSNMPAQHTYAASEHLTSTNLQTHSSGIAWHLGSRPRTRASNATGTTQSIGNNVWTTLTYGAVAEDTEGGMNGGTGVYTAQVSGWYIVSISTGWDVNTTGDRALHLKGSAGNVIGLESSPAAGSPGSYIGQSYTNLVRMNAGDTIYGQGFQSSGGNLNCSVGTANAIYIHWIRGL